jgi:hypothetical protein
MSLVQLETKRERRRRGSALMGKVKAGGHRLGLTMHAWGRVANGSTRCGRLGAAAAAQALEVEDEGGHGPAGPNWAW